VTRVLEGGPQFWSDYDDTAQTLCSELIATLARKPPTPGQAALLKALVEPVLSLERRQSWSDDRSFTWRTFAIVPGTLAWATRELVLSRAKAVLAAEDTPTESRVQLWHVFSRLRDGNALEKLKWTYGVLTGRSPSIEELAAARQVWNWHRRYEKNPDLKMVADALEALYARNDLAREFQSLLPDVEDRKERDDRASTKAAELALAASPNEISAFLDRAATFFGSDQSIFRLGSVAWSLGAHAEAREVVRKFIREALGSPSIDPRAEFVGAAAVSWVAAVRSTAPERAHVLVRELLEKCGSDERRAHLLERIYGRVPRLRDANSYTIEERALLRDSRHLFEGTRRDAAFVAALALSVGEDWPMLQPLLEDVLKAVPAERRSHAMYALVDAIYWAVQVESASGPPRGLAEWLLTQLLALPDLGDIGGNGEWHLAEIVKRLGRPDVRWLAEALMRRKGQEAASDDTAKSRAISYNARVSKYVRQIAAADVSDADVVAALCKVLDLVHDDGSVGYYLPEILRDVDPEGLVAPAAVAVRLASATDAEGVRRLARVGKAYAINSSPWRAIALAAIRAAGPFGGEALRAVYGSLGERGVRSWSGAVGEVPPVFIAAVAEARAALDGEVQVELRPYWQQRLAIAEAELREQEEHSKEERGE
jgi:hypothetical protein